MRNPSKRKPARTPSLTPTMRLALKNLADGLPPDNHCRGRSEFGGFNNTRAALIQRGWMTADHQLTDAGRTVIGRSAPSDPSVPRDQS